MRRELIFFDPAMESAVGAQIELLHRKGARNVLLIRTERCNDLPVGAFERVGLSWSEKELAHFRGGDLANIDVVFIPDASGSAVSRALHLCIDADVAVMAPITDHHYSRRTLFLTSIPKAGTHMIIRLFEIMGLQRSSEWRPLPGTWSTPAGYAYHAPCKEMMANDAFEAIGRQLLFRSPAIFVYRHPLDIVVSELDWFVKPDHVFAGYLSSFGNTAEQLARLIADDSVMGTIRDRINRYAGWVHFSNVIPVSYEELVGSRGGGSDDEQLNSIWSLQLKLHIAGSPEDYARFIYDPESPTFVHGRIGRHVQCFEQRHLELFASLPGDFMQTLGYRQGSSLSSKVSAFRHRPLIVKELPPELLYTPRLALEGISRWNVIESAGKYFPVRQGEQITSASDLDRLVQAHDGFVSLRSAMDAVISKPDLPSPVSDGESTVIATAQPEVNLDYDSEPQLLEEGYRNFNFVAYERRVWAVDQTAGPVDFRDPAELERLTTDGVVISAPTLDHARLILDRLLDGRLLDGRLSAATAQLKSDIEALSLDLDGKLSELTSRLAGFTGSLTALPEQLADLRERVDATASQFLALHPRREEIPDPQLLEAGRQSFNIVAYGKNVWAVDQASGPSDLRDPAVIKTLTSDGRLVAAESLEEARLAVDCLVAADTRAALRERNLAAMAGRGFEELRSKLLEAAGAMRGLQERIEETENLRGVLAELRGSLAMLHGEFAEFQRQIDRIEHNALVRLGAYLKKPARLNGART